MVAVTGGPFRRPDGTLWPRATVTFELVGDSGALAEVADDESTDVIVGPSTVPLDEAGNYSIDLTPNDQLLPAGTRWARTLKADGRIVSTRDLLVDEIGGDEERMYSDPPGTLPSPALALHEAETIQGDGVHGGPLNAGDVGADPEGTADIAVNAHDVDPDAHPVLDARLDAVELDAAALLEREQRTVTWFTVDSWDRFTRVPASNVSHTTPVYGVGTNGDGTITGGEPSTGNTDRSVWRLDDIPPFQDVEVHLTQTVETGAQAGLALRLVQNPGEQERAILLMNDALIGLPGLLGVVGIWRWDAGGAGVFENDVGFTQQGVGIVSLLSTSGDGSTATARTRTPHEWNVGDTIAIAGAGVFTGNRLITAVPDAMTVQFAHASTSTVAGGQAFTYSGRRRTLGARLIGDRLQYTAWLTDTQAQPQWSDPIRVVTQTLPVTHGPDDYPTVVAGALGIAGGHLGASRQIVAADLRIWSLDRRNAPAWEFSST